MSTKLLLEAKNWAPLLGGAISLYASACNKSQRKNIKLGQLLIGMAGIRRGG